MKLQHSQQLTALQLSVSKSSAEQAAQLCQQVSSRQQGMSAASSSSMHFTVHSVTGHRASLLLSHSSCSSE